MTDIDMELVERAIKHVAYIHGTVKSPVWLRNVNLHQYTAGIDRDRSMGALLGCCGAEVAEAFRPTHPHGCLRRDGHDGDHSAIPETAHSMDTRDDRRNAMKGHDQ